MKTLINAADRLGMASAGLCLMHCLALPAFIVLLPFLDWQESGEETHRYLAALALLFALVSLIPGYFLHRRRSALMLGMVGLACIISATFVVEGRYGEVLEVLLTVAGAAMLFTSHLRNSKYCRSLTT